jgi:hypothetical protein
MLLRLECIGVWACGRWKSSVCVGGGGVFVPVDGQLTSLSLTIKLPKGARKPGNTLVPFDTYGT